MKKRILIAVKTYPTLSEKYNELVCTAGFLDDGSWIRIYPIQFRQLNFEQQYSKWSYIEVDVEKNLSDYRVESYRPIDIAENLKIVGKLGTENGWAARKEIVLKNMSTNLADLIQRVKDENISLAVYKPAEIIDFVWESQSREWDKKKLDKVKANLSQRSLFEEKEAVTNLFKVVKKLPYKFSYRFLDQDGSKHKLMIEDWEVGALYWKCINNGDTEETACQKVKNKFFDDFLKKDLYFLLGTTLEHGKSKSPFIIIGAFYPPKRTSKQPSLFD